MKVRVFIGVVLPLVLLLVLSGCATGIPPEDYDAAVAERDTAQAELEAAQRQVETLQSDLTVAQAQMQDLQSEYDKTRSDLLEGIKQSELKNPTWQELKEFLQLDDTDELLYDIDSFDCTGFAITLRDNAQGYGIRCAFVEIGFFEGEGHALNAFETTDRGLVYVDTTESDKMAYLKMNKPYGTISLDGAKIEYIACSGDPDEFWAPLTYGTHADPFSYDYYTDYQRRKEFYQESIAAYNQAADEFNRGSTMWSYSELTAWLENLEALVQDLGSNLFEAGGTVNNIQIYWN